MSVGSKSLPARRGNEGHENGDGAVAREEGDLATGGGGSKSLPARRGNEGHDENADGAVARAEGDMAMGGSVGGGGSRSRKQKSARYGRCFSELSIGPGPLKDVDAGRLKGQIKRWAKAVVAFARQISFGSPRSVPTPRGGGGDDTPRSAPLQASRSSSRLGARRAKEGASDDVRA